MYHDAMTEAAHQSIGGFEPQDGTELDGWLQGLPDMLTEQATAFKNLADKLGSDFPVEQAFVDMLHELSNVIQGAGDTAGEVYDTHRSVHEREMQRIEEPRPQESMWNV